MRLASNQRGESAPWGGAEGEEEGCEEGCEGEGGGALVGLFAIISDAPEE